VTPQKSDLAQLLVGLIAEKRSGLVRFLDALMDLRTSFSYLKLKPRYPYGIARTIKESRIRTPDSTGATNNVIVIAMAQQNGIRDHTAKRACGLQVQKQANFWSAMSRSLAENDDSP
jgi:hypothetical protein